MQFISLLSLYDYLRLLIGHFSACQSGCSRFERNKTTKATAIASRLLKELAGEKLASHHQETSSNHKDESKDSIVPVNRPAVEKVESHVEKANDNHADEDDEEEIDFLPTIEDLYEIYGNKYAQLVGDEESSSEDIDDEYVLPVSAQQLLRYLAEQEESDDLIPVIHTPVMDDSVMTAEDHQRRRRRRSIY